MHRIHPFRSRGSATAGAAVALLLAAVVLPGCSSKARVDHESAPIFDGTGEHHRPVDTASTDAQRQFDQGLAFLYAFNHDEAIRSFEAATEHDPRCAMAHWGIAFAKGPHINNPVVPPEREAEAFAAASTAASLLSTVQRPADRALIEAIGTRYAQPQAEDRAPFDQAFADAMGDVYRRFPGDGDVGALYAESLLDLHPWDLYEHDGTAKPWTPAVVGLLEEVIEDHPRHPLALHLYIHAVEASDDPGRADVAADRLRHLTPGLGHLVHMPSHIDVLRGRWQEALEANTRAVEADRAYRQKSAEAPDFYRLYMSHNHHMRAFAAMMTGQRREALTSIRRLVDEIPEGWLRENASWADGFVAMPYEVLMRFGMWEEILDEPKPADYLPFTTAIHHAARAVALAALDRPEEARREQRRFVEASSVVPEDATFGNNDVHDLLGVAEQLVEGEILYREGEVDAGIDALYEAAEREANLRYDEPPDWIQPIRHALGATLLQEGRYAEAEEAYRQDLETWPRNGWSLFGLSRSLRLQERHAEAKVVEAEFDEVWKKADTPLASSCFCQPGV